MQPRLLPLCESLGENRAHKTKSWLFGLLSLSSQVSLIHPTSIIPSFNFPPRSQRLPHAHDPPTFPCRVSPNVLRAFGWKLAHTKGGKLLPGNPPPWIYVYMNLYGLTFLQWDQTRIQSVFYFLPQSSLTRGLDWIEGKFDEISKRKRSWGGQKVDVSLCKCPHKAAQTGDKILQWQNIENVPNMKYFQTCCFHPEPAEEKPKPWWR